MSKSDPSDQSRINLTDDADAIAQKIKRATTDPHPLPDSVDGLKGRPEAENLVGIYAAMAGVPAADVLKEFGGKGFGQFKPALAELLASKLAPVAGEMRRLMNDPAGLDDVLRQGAARAEAIAAPIMENVRKIVGFWR
jgi:tryptophanyl-tRNA synthetase